MPAIAYLHIASLSFTIFFVFLLLSKKGKSLGDYLLMLFFSFLAINYGTMLVISLDLPGYTWLIEISDASVFLYGPLLWCYVLSFTEIDFRLSSTYWGHGFPFLLALVVLEAFFLSGTEVPDPLRRSFLVLKMASMLFYLLLVFANLRKYRSQLKTFFSTTDKIQLDWMYFLCWSILIVWGISVVSLSLFFFAQIDIPLHGGLYSNIAVSLCVFVMGWYGFRQSQVFSPAYMYKSLLQEQEIETPEIKYRNSGLQEAEAQVHLQKLLTFMEESKPYLDQDLSLFKLSEEMQLSPNHLSQIINSLRQQNFFDFINAYRVAEVKKLMARPLADQLTLLGIAMEAGFKSKASFNRAFKKFTGLTPSVYKEQLRD